MAITHIEAFIKGLSVRMICARVKQGMPMLLEHALGHDCENSHVRFLIAPKQQCGPTPKYKSVQMVSGRNAAMSRSIG